MLLSVASVFGFLRYSLEMQAHSYVQDFSLQNSIDLSQGEVFPIARKLGAIAKKEQFICILATKAQNVFFEDIKSNCEPSLFQTKQVVADKIQDIQIQFTIRMPREIILGLLFFLAAQGILVGLIFFGERKNIFEKLRGELEMAALARQIGHDIRSPLAVLRFSANEKDSESLRKSALNRLEELCTHLLKKEEDRLHIARVNSVIQEIVQEKKAEFPSEIGIKCDLALMPHIFLPGDAFYWRRIISNIVNNAVEAKISKRVEVQLFATATEDSVEIAIKDNGSGFSQEALDGVGKGSFSSGKKFGTGLGISSAQKYLEKMGGTLLIESSQGSGSTIRLRFPKLDQIVLIDDDAEFGELWRNWADQKEISFRFLQYSEGNEFLRQVESIASSAIVFLDKNLGTTIDYRTLAKGMKNRGISQIYLCSGEGDLNHDLPPCIQGKVRKEPPNIEKPLSNC